MENAKLSVLMSIYNETESQIRESVNSILNQSFCDFEYIIVCDNPIRNKEIESLINGFKDKRIIYLNLWLLHCNRRRRRRYITRTIC